MQLLGPQVTHSWARQRTNTWVNALPCAREREARGLSLLQVVGQVAAKATWPMGRTGGSMVPVQVTSKQAANQ